ncbi:hypothetical protein SLA2020_406720 [Shorea laevis]
MPMVAFGVFRRVPSAAGEVGRIMAAPLSVLIDLKLGGCRRWPSAYSGGGFRWVPSRLRRHGGLGLVN